MKLNKKDIELVNSVARIKNRVAVTDYYYDELPKDVRSLAFTVSNLETLRQIQMVQKSLDNATEEGFSFDTWKANLDTEVIKNLSDARLETVYRTNTHNVYNQSTRFNAMTSRVTPYLMYTAVGDERTRPEHMKLDGVIKRADSVFWDKYTPPLGFNCRCGTIPMSKEDAEGMGISNRSADSFPEPEFGKSKMGDVLSGASREAERAIEGMPKSSLKTKFENAQDSTKSLVDLWYDKNKNIFKGDT